MVKAFIYFPLKFCLQFFDEIFRIPRYVAALRYVVPDDTIDVFNLALFPGMVGVAKVNGYTKDSFQLFVVLKKQVVISGHGYPFRISFLDPQAGNGYRIQARS